MASQYSDVTTDWKTLSC